MALTDKQKNQVLYYLGWPLKTLITDSTHYQKTIADRFENLNTQIEDIVDDLLDKLEEIDKKLEKARCRLSASKVDDITLNKNEIQMLLKERRRCRNELHRILDIPVLVNDGQMVNVCV